MQATAMPIICIPHSTASWTFAFRLHFYAKNPPTPPLFSKHPNTTTPPTHRLALPLAKWPFSVTVRFMEASSKRVTMSPLGTCAIPHLPLCGAAVPLNTVPQYTSPFQLINSHFLQWKNTRTVGERFNLLIEACHPPQPDLKIKNTKKHTNKTSSRSTHHIAKWQTPSAKRFRLSICSKLMKRVALKAPHEWHALRKKLGKLARFINKYMGYTNEYIHW